MSLVAVALSLRGLVALPPCGQANLPPCGQANLPPCGQANLPLRSQKMKGSQFEVFERAHRPTIGAIGRGVAGHRFGPAAATAQQIAYGHAPCARPLQCAHGRGKPHPCGRADGCVLAFEERLRLGRPRHDLGVEYGPVRRQRSPQLAALKGPAHVVQELRFQARIRKEAAARARVADADTTVLYAKVPLRGRRVAADDQHGPRPHLLLLADELAYAAAAIVREDLVRVFEQVRAGAGLGRGHRRRQIDQPTGINREAAHHLQGRSRPLRMDDNSAHQPRLHAPAAGYIR